VLISLQSTAIHAAIVCPSSVRVLNHPPPSDYAPGEGAVLVVPDGRPLSAEDFLGDSPITEAIFVDATWAGAARVAAHPALATLPRVAIGGGRRTAFWRHQTNKPDTHLATIEVRALNGVNLSLLKLFYLLLINFL